MTRLLSGTMAVISAKAITPTNALLGSHRRANLTRKAIYSSVAKKSSISVHIMPVTMPSSFQLATVD